MQILRAFLLRRRRSWGGLRRRREEVQAELEALAREIAGLRGSRPEEPKPKPKKTRKKTTKAKGDGKRKGKTFPAAVVEVLARSGKAMRAREIAEQLPGVGYTSRSKDLKNLVSSQIGQMKGLKRVRTGLYALEKQPPPEEQGK